MTVTPWTVARLNALSVLLTAIARGGPRFDKEGEEISAEEAGFDAALAVLSKHGYAIVPKLATQDMVENMVKVKIAAHGTWVLEINAAIESGDVLRVEP